MGDKMREAMDSSYQKIKLQALYLREIGELSTADDLDKNIETIMQAIATPPTEQTGKQVGWCWVEGVSTDPYTCKFQPLEPFGNEKMNQLDTAWFVEHKWAPMFIGSAPAVSLPSVVEIALTLINSKRKTWDFPEMTMEELLEKGQDSATYPHAKAVHTLLADRLGKPVEVERYDVKARFYEHASIAQDGMSSGVDKALAVIQKDIDALQSAGVGAKP